MGNGNATGDRCHNGWYCCMQKVLMVHLAETFQFRTVVGHNNSLFDHTDEMHMIQIAEI